TATCPIYRADITVRPDTGEMYTVLVDNQDNNLGIYRSLPVLGQPVVWTQMGQAGIDSCAGVRGGSEDGCGTGQGTFNLYLRAVPNGSNTDVYLGAINIFKCSVSPTSDPFCTLPGAWKN